MPSGLAPGTKFADIIGEIDPAKLAGGESMSAEEALHFGLIPRMHRGIFAVNELPELDELVQVGLFNILEERDVQIRGYPIRFDLDIFLLFSANPSTFNRSGKVIPQLKDRIGSVIHTHYPRSRDMGIEIMEQEAGIDLGGEYPVVVPYFMREIIEEVTVQARKSKYVDQQSGVSARFSIANYRTMVASARHRGVLLGEKPSVPRISDLGRIYSSSLGKLELDLMGSHQMSERQVLDAVLAQAIRKVFEEYVDKHGLAEISEIFNRGVNPAIIQGGMGVGVSGWRLARAVSRAGQLGVVSGTGLDVVLVRRLQLGDVGGHVRRALDFFPLREVAERIVDRYFVPGGKPAISRSERNRCWR
jgi:magnesium chelatase subunit I